MNDNQPAAIMASTTTCRTMADGSLRISCDIEPRHARDAFAMFGSPGTPVALARITQTAAQREAMTSFQQPVKGGQLCKLAAIWSADPDFHAFLKHTLKWAGEEDLTSIDAAQIIRDTCGVASRADIDHNADAAAIFHRDFRIPFSKWLQGARN